MANTRLTVYVGTGDTGSVVHGEDEDEDVHEEEHAAWRSSAPRRHFNMR
jgi:hypothetical protein